MTTASSTTSSWSAAAQRARRRGLLARAGLSVLVLERLGPRAVARAVSAPAFSGHAARLSRYSYLVSLLPSSFADLDLDLRLASRSVASSRRRCTADTRAACSSSDDRRSHPPDDSAPRRERRSERVRRLAALLRDARRGGRSDCSPTLHRAAAVAGRSALAGRQRHRLADAVRGADLGGDRAHLQLGVWSAGWSLTDALIGIVRRCGRIVI